MHKRLNRFWIGAFAAVIGVSAGTAKAQTADTTNYVMANFDYSNPLSSDLWGFWYFYSDNNVATSVDTVMGNSELLSFPSGSPLYDTTTLDYDTASFPVGRGGEAGTRSLRFGYKLGDRKLSCGDSCSYPGFVGFGMHFTTRYDTVDMKTAKAVSFWARSDSDTVMCEVSVLTRDDPPNGAYAQAFAIGPVWKKYTINLAASAVFKQPTWVPQVPFNAARSYGVAWAISRSYAQNDKHPVNAIRIDDLTIEGWTYVEPIPPDPDAIRSTARRIGSRQGYRLQIQGSQIRVIRDGERVPLNLNGRAGLSR